MSETAQNAGGPEAGRAHVDWFCDWIREGAERTAEMFTMPASAGQHFRDSRIEFWRGIRDLIDRRIDRLSRNERNKGTRVVVE